MRKQRLVLIGNGVAGVRTLEEILRHDAQRYDMTVIGDEPCGNYNRIQLSPVLAGEQTLSDIILNPESWYEKNGIRLIKGVAATGIDRVQRVVTLANGEAVGYDKLIVATGSRPFMLPIPGAQLPGVLGFRDIKDTTAMIEAAAQYKHAVVIGGGLLGLEAAHGLKLRGMEVSVVHLGEWLLNRQLDQQAGRMLEHAMRDHGLQLYLGQTASRLLGDQRVTGVELGDGTVLKADLVVMAAGIVPNDALARAAGLKATQGIVVDDTLKTSDPFIYALGECVNHRGTSYGLVAPLFEMGKVLANQLAGCGKQRYTGTTTSTKLKVTGIDLFSAGDFMGGESYDEIVVSDPKGGIYKKLVLKDDVLVGACLYGDTGEGAWYYQLLREGRNVADMRRDLLSGPRELGDVGTAGASRAAALPMDAEVCGCNGVSKGTIVKAITEHGLFTVEEVKKHTRAGASCGSCTGLVEQILMSTVGSSFQAAPKQKPLCDCTTHTHEDVREAIRNRHLTSLPAVMKALQWRTPDGCPTCRPALNYYLISSWPGEAKDDAQARLVNERMHANIQKDSTFSVIPRMWGGVTSPAELRRIADVAEKYEVRMVKVTGGQRLDLLGVKGSDLPAIWKDLDMPSGMGYSKGLRTVKTCVGKQFCRFGTQDSTGMGIELEKALDRMWAPHKVKLAVSGCPRNCAEAGIKDVGIIAVDSGWELYIGGNGGIKTEVAEFLVKVKTATEVMEYSGAFLQLYREQAHYLERTVHFMQRVGLDYIKQRVLEDEAGRKALWARLQQSLALEPDPWRARDGVDANQFAALPA
ncbi:nitrite reductase (NADH) large subunit [Silvimonas terrae]|uniref:Nitrite reductase (NADH) large subunit n=1 Tax=Silvimonas terrae TaxID=300266 RepID=A0A840R9E3_9NEIS|nr:nitrite reductase large subunit NirB [Silvimonas terrae]MBB5189989.1 nitrite reductase (NADH) large subunit [Silvimonas terrae]